MLSIWPWWGFSFLILTRKNHVSTYIFSLVCHSMLVISLPTSCKKHFTFSLNLDLFSSEFHPPVARPLPSLILWGVILILLSIFLPSGPSLFFSFPALSFEIFFLPSSLRHHHLLRCNLSRCLLFCLMSPASLSICKLPWDQNLRRHFNESRPA